ncbi:TCP-1/cpn60 chaperonin family protein [Halomarina halobia]|uniref:TCP-1/cpn60 chaperonin family protein n=1 Tax=Halomarina halobia TaxID=3033386 RepID=A0ABD6AEF8_9EURY|nr:TCP-1/cpn60 chaperonin family protein [Halomarina sp. PSR21]
MAVEWSPTTGSVLSGDELRENFRAAADSFVDLTGTMLGPRGMYKLVVPKEGGAIVTRDCLRVLRTVEVDHPIGRLLYGVASGQGDRCGDGVVTSLLLASRLITGSLDAVTETGLHPRTVHAGLDRARVIAERTLADVAVPVDPDPTTDHLRAVATAQVRTKLLDGAEFAPLVTETLAALARDARPSESGGLLLDTENRAHVFARTGPSRRETRRFDGVLVKKELQNADRKSVRDARVATVDRKLYLETVRGDEETGRRLRASTPETLEAFRRAEDAVHERLVRPLLDAGVDVLVTRKGIDDRVTNALVREGVLVIRRARPEGILESVAAATGATVVGDVRDLGPADLGHAGIVEERRFGPLAYTLVGECRGAAANSILTRGGTWTGAEDVGRGLEAALRATAAAVREPAVVPGGGFAEIRVARALRSAAARTSTREALVLERAASAFEAVVRTLAGNAGLDELDALTTLRARVPAETAGVVDADDGPAAVGDVRAAGVLDPLRVKRGAVSSAVQAATYAIPVDEVIAVE